MPVPAKMPTNESTLEEIPIPEVVNLFTGRFHDLILALPPNFMNMSEAEIAAELDPTPLDYALRRQFWNVVNDARTMKKSNIHTSKVYEGLCSRVYFEESFMQKHLKLAWLLRPIVPHESYYEAINRVCIQKLLEYATNNPVSEKNLAAILKLAEMSANRAYGAVVQKIQTKNLNLEGRIPDADKPPAADSAQLEARARELQAKLTEPQVIDVTPEEK